MERITAREITFWQAFEKVEGPIGTGRIDLLAAYIGYMSTRASDKCQPDDAVAIFSNFRDEVLADPIDKITDEDLNLTPPQKKDALLGKIFDIFGRPPGFNGGNEK